jgi:GR25 family glycosyltransferase involved in LPS biosynthesis
LKNSLETNSSFVKSCYEANILSHRFKTIDGSLIQRNINNILSNEEYGFLLSHKYLWEKYKNSDKPVIICEDNIIFNKNITRNVIRKLEFMEASNIDWNIILLFSNTFDESFDNGIENGDCYLDKSYNHFSYKGYGIIEFGWQETRMNNIKRKDLLSCITCNSCYIVKPEICEYLANLSIFYEDKLSADIILSIAIKQLKKTYYLQGQVKVTRKNSNMY